MEGMQDLNTFVVCGGYRDAGYIEVITSEDEYKALDKAEAIHGSHCAVIYSLGNIPEDLYEFLAAQGAIDDGYGSFDQKEFEIFCAEK